MPDGQVVNVLRGFGYSLKDTSPFMEEVFHPPFVDYFFAADPDARRALTTELHRTNYRSADLDVIRALYALRYEDRLDGRERLELVTNHEIEAVAERPDGVRLRLREKRTGDRDGVDVDAVILATGFRNIGPGPEEERFPPLVAGIVDELARDRHGCVLVERDYRVPRADGLPTPALFLNGVCESTHGLGDAGSFGQVALRAERIVARLRALGRAPAGT